MGPFGCRYFSSWMVLGRRDGTKWCTWAAGDLGCESGCEFIAGAVSAVFDPERAVPNVLLCPRNEAQTLMTPIFQQQPAGKVRFSAASEEIHFSCFMLIHRTASTGLHHCDTTRISQTVLLIEVMFVRWHCCAKKIKN